jgi:hypothetical protein
LEAALFLHPATVYDLRSQDPKRVLEQTRRFADRPAIVAQAFLELALLLSTRPQLIEYTRKLGGIVFVTDMLKRYADQPFVQEQVRWGSDMNSCVSNPSEPPHQRANGPCPRR